MKVHRTFRVLREERPGPQWRGHFRSCWPDYERWFLLEGERARPTYRECRRMLQWYMPEIVPLYEELVELAGGSDRVARMLSLYRPTPYLAGCSQVVWTQDEPVLVRNYDYRPDLWEAVALATRWHDRNVIAMSDCLWGVLDGMNDKGLVVSLTFGGRRIVGDGFGIPIVLRHILETCDTVREAGKVIQRIPVHMAHNVLMVDARGDFASAYLGPDRFPILRQWPISTNHQETWDWPEYLAATGSYERESFLASRLADPTESAETLASRFLAPPLYRLDYRRGLGTLYTSVYRPAQLSAEFRWPGLSCHQSLKDLKAAEFVVEYLVA